MPSHIHQYTAQLSDASNASAHGLVSWLSNKAVQSTSYMHLYIAWPLTLVLLDPDMICFANSVDPDQLASEEANWSGSALFDVTYVNL